MMPNNIFCCNGQHYVYMPNGPGVQGAQPGYPAAVPQHPVYQFPGASQPAQPPPPPPPRERSCPSVQAAHAVAAALPQQNGLVADLCKIIERQSQEIASLVNNRNNGAGASSAASTAAPQEAPKSPSQSVAHPVPQPERPHPSADQTMGEVRPTSHCLQPTCPLAS